MKNSPTGRPTTFKILYLKVKSKVFVPFHFKLFSSKSRQREISGTGHIAILMPGIIPWRFRLFNGTTDMFDILIVEDNTTFRKSLNEMLTDRFSGIRVLEASDASEALDVVAREKPDLIFMDVRLPGVNGLDLTRKIKNAYCDITIIMLTNYDLEEYREAAERYGADHFIPKGTSSREDIIRLVETIRCQRMSSLAQVDQSK